MASLTWQTDGAEDCTTRMRNAILQVSDTSRLADYLGFCSQRTDIDPAESAMFQEVLARGTPEEQVIAIRGIGLVRTPSVRHALIRHVKSQSAPLLARERALEMLHKHPCRETAEFCIEALKDQAATIRFWAVYTLGQVAQFRQGLREMAANALSQVLNDEGVMPGWWSVAREAQSVIVRVRYEPGERQRRDAEIRRIAQDPDASPEDKRWAGFYGS